MRYVEGLVAEMIWQRSFNKLAQEKDVEVYIKKFVKNLIFNDFDANPYLSKAYFISSYKWTQRA